MQIEFPNHFINFKKNFPVLNAIQDPSRWKKKRENLKVVSHSFSPGT